MPIIETKNLTKIYKMGNETVYALNDVSLQIMEEEFVSVIGPSGSGKTTLLNMLGALDYPTSGEVIIDNVNITKLEEEGLHEIRRKKVGQIFQQFYLIPTLSALENVILPLVPTKVEKEKAVKMAMELLELVNLKDRANHKPSELSGGQQQRVAIARALINNPKIILADEPTGNLDTKRGEEIINLLKKLNESGITIVLVTHNINLARKTKRIIALRDGKVVSDEKFW